MEVDVLGETREKAELELAALKLLFKQRGELKNDQVYRNLQRAYGHMKHGGKIIDVHAAISNAGLNDKGNPKIAICRADANICYITKDESGTAIISGIPAGSAVIKCSDQPNSFQLSGGVFNSWTSLAYRIESTL